MRNNNLHMRRTLIREISKYNRKNQSHNQNSGYNAYNQPVVTSKSYVVYGNTQIVLDPKKEDFDGSACIYAFSIAFVALVILGIIICMFCSI